MHCTGCGVAASPALFVCLSSRFERADENGFAADDWTVSGDRAVLDSATDQGGPEVLEKTALPFGLVFLAAVGVNRRSFICIFSAFPGAKVLVL